jgi:hypothetical protein
VRQHIEHHRSFAVETTLRTTAAVTQAQLARSRGFVTHLRFIATVSVSENVTRVLQRAQGGGHGASKQDIRAIHDASLRILRQAISVFEWARVYDSTRAWAPPRLLGLERQGAHVTALDSTFDAVRTCRMLARLFDSRVDFQLATFEGFATARRFDAVVLLSVLHHVLLGPNGRVRAEAFLSRAATSAKVLFFDIRQEVYEDLNLRDSMGIGQWVFSTTPYRHAKVLWTDAWGRELPCFRE